MHVAVSCEGYSVPGSSARKCRAGPTTGGERSAQRAPPQVTAAASLTARIRLARAGWSSQPPAQHSATTPRLRDPAGNTHTPVPPAAGSQVPARSDQASPARIPPGQTWPAGPAVLDRNSRIGHPSCWAELPWLQPQRRPDRPSRAAAPSTKLVTRRSGCTAAWLRSGYRPSVVPHLHNLRRPPGSAGPPVSYF